MDVPLLLLISRSHAILQGCAHSDTDPIDREIDSEITQYSAMCDSNLTHTIGHCNTGVHAE
jgi:hypothetical protein